MIASPKSMEPIIKVSVEKQPTMQEKHELGNNQSLDTTVSRFEEQSSSVSSSSVIESVSSTKHSQHGTTKSDGSSENVRKNLVGSETQRVQRLRLTTLCMMFVVAMAVSVLVFMLVNTTEMQEFHTQYDSAANKLIDSFHNIIQHAGSVSTVSNAATISAYDQSRFSPSNRSWPFVTLTAFEKQTSVARLLSGALYISLDPLVTNDERDDWEVYVTKDENKQWM
jgi:hypothetical protein